MRGTEALVAPEHLNRLAREQGAKLRAAGPAREAVAVLEPGADRGGEPVGDAQPCGRSAEPRGQVAGELRPRHLQLVADVEGLARGTGVLECERDRVEEVLDVAEARHGAAAVHEQHVSCFERPCDLAHELLRARAVHGGGAQDRALALGASHRALGFELRLGVPVGEAGRGVALRERRAAGMPVDVGGADVDEPCDALCVGRAEHVDRAGDVGRGDLRDRRPVGDHGRAVHDPVGSGGRAAQRDGVGERAGAQLYGQTGEHAGVAALAHQAAHPVAVPAEPSRQRGADEAARPGDQHDTAGWRRGAALRRRRHRLSARRFSVAVAMSRTAAQLRPVAPWQSSSTASSAARNESISASETVSGGSSLITSFLPAAIVMTPWSRCSGITIELREEPLAGEVDQPPADPRRTAARRAELDPCHQAAGADLAHDLVPAPELLQAAREHLAHVRGMLDEAVALDHAHRRQPGCHRQAVAAERRLVHVGALERADRALEDLAACRHRRDRQEPAAERLADQHEVRFEPVVLEREPAAGAPQPGLDLVEHEQGAVAPAELLGAAEPAVGRERDHAPLDGLDDERRDVAGAQLALERVEVAEGHARAARQHRSEAFLEELVADERKRPKGDPVEAALAGEEAGPAGGRARELHGGVDRLRSRAREEDRVDAVREPLHQRLRQHPGERRVVDLHAVGEAGRERRLQHRPDVGVVVAEAREALAGVEVQVGAPVRVVEVGAAGGHVLPVEPEDREHVDE